MNPESCHSLLEKSLTIQASIYQAKISIHTLYIPDISPLLLCLPPLECAFYQWSPKSKTETNCPGLRLSKKQNKKWKQKTPLNPRILYGKQQIVSDWGILFLTAVKTNIHTFFKKTCLNLRSNSNGYTLNCISLRSIVLRNNRVPCGYYTAFRFNAFLLQWPIPPPTFLQMMTCGS